MLGSLQVSASFYGATTFHADLDGVVAVLALNVYMLLLSLSALVIYSRGRYENKKKKGGVECWTEGADTVADLLAYIVNSDCLRQDVREARESNTGRPKSTCMYHLDVDQSGTAPPKIERK